MARAKRQTEGERSRAELARALREADRRTLERLRSEVDERRRAKREALLGVRSLCRSERERLRDMSRELREQQGAVALARETLKEQCQATRDQTREAGKSAIEQARATARAERKHQAIARRDERRRPATGPALAKGAGARRAAEARSESDDEVRSNIDPRLWPLWDRVRRTIRGSARRTRTEAFLEWLHDHPEAQYELAEAEAAAELRRLEHEHEAHKRRVRRRGRYDRSAAELAAEVPF